MKLTILLFCVFITLSSCHLSFLEDIKSFLPTPKDDDPFRNLGDFFEGLFSHYNLPRPQQILNCFCDKTATLYFKSLYDFNKLYQDTVNRKSVSVHLDIIKLSLLGYAFKKPTACMIMTQDFADFLDALNIEEKDLDKIHTIMYIYYQGHYAKLAEGFRDIINNLDKKDFNSAGESYGILLDDIFNTTEKEGVSFIAYAGFANGGAISLDIDDPDDSLQCFNNETATLWLEFLYELTTTVIEGKFREAPLNVMNFMIGQGKEILEKIPASVFQCYADSADNEKIKEKLGIDINSKEFRELVKKYINNNRFMFYIHSKCFKSAIDNLNFHHAGSLYTAFLNAVAQLK